MKSPNLEIFFFLMRLVAIKLLKLLISYVLAGGLFQSLKNVELSNIVLVLPLLQDSAVGVNVRE